MQRKRNIVHYADNIELGANLIPVSRSLMRKFKMKSLIKYGIVGIVCFSLFSVYQKITIVSKRLMEVIIKTIYLLKLKTDGRVILCFLLLL